MKVRRLIELLEKCDQEREVVYLAGLNRLTEIEHVLQGDELGGIGRRKSHEKINIVWLHSHCPANSFFNDYFGKEIKE